jgi:hypothetical protein
VTEVPLQRGLGHAEQQMDQCCGVMQLSIGVIELHVECSSCVQMPYVLPANRHPLSKATPEMTGKAFENASGPQLSVMCCWLGSPAVSVVATTLAVKRLGCPAD